MYKDNTVKKIEEIQFMLAAGKSRTEVAKELGYKDYHGLYRFVSRHKLKWNPRILNYETVGNDGKPIQAVKEPVDNPTGKVANIISMFERGIDGRDIAKKLRFESYKAMAEYMRSKGYLWNEHKQNYEKKAQEIRPEQEQKCAESIISVNTKKYDDLFEMLYQNFEKVKELLNTDIEVKSIPRYILPGVVVTKTISMVNTLDQLIKSFCDENNITQRELFEIAVIDFLRKHGYKDEVKANLKV